MDYSVKQIKVVCVTSNKIFNSIGDAEKYIGHRGVTLCCQGKRKSCGLHPVTGEKLRWMYYDEYIKQNKLLIHNENLEQAI